MKRLHRRNSLPWRPALPRWAQIKPLSRLNVALGLSILAFGGVKWLSSVETPPRSRLARSAVVAATTSATPEFQVVTEYVPPLGPRHQFNYDQWVSLLHQEAIAIEAQAPEHLDILLGDSITLWFPPDLLPSDRTWLNQGISGDTAPGLLNRLYLVDRTAPDTIFVMIGINDLIRGQSPESVIEATRQIVRYLIRVHPQATIVVQSILPHAGATASWEGRGKLLALPNSRIQHINHALAAIATEYPDANIRYLDLYPLFIDPAGNLNANLTTDGLHLNRQGYLVWRTALQLTQLEPAPRQNSPQPDPQEATEFGRLSRAHLSQ